MPIDITVAGRTLSADTSTMAAPVVMRVPDVDCLGSWSGCGADCGTKFFVYAVTPSGGGAPCSHAHGDTESCAAGEGACAAAAGSSSGTTEVNTMLLAVLVGAVCALLIIAVAAFVWLCHHHRSKVGGGRVLHVRPPTPQGGVYTVQGTVVNAVPMASGWTMTPDLSQLPVATVTAKLSSAAAGGLEEACPIAHPYEYEHGGWGGSKAGAGAGWSKGYGA